jgi:hypothetical protein
MAATDVFKGSASGRAFFSFQLVCFIQMAAYRPAFLEEDRISPMAVLVASGISA